MGEEQTVLSSKSKRRKRHGEGCLRLEFSLNLCLHPIPSVSSQFLLRYNGAKTLLLQQKTEIPAAQAVHLSSLATKLHRCKLGSKNNGNIQTITR